MKYTMADGRAFTSYIPNCELNVMLQKKYGITDLHTYRYYLQQNAQDVMNETRITSDECKLCEVCEDSLEYVPKGN